MGEPFSSPPDQGIGTDGQTGIESNPSSFSFKNPIHPVLTDGASEVLYDHKFERSEEFESMASALHHDGDLIKDPSFLEKCASLSPQQRLVLLTPAARQSYTSPDDFADYIEHFPNDTELVIGLVLDEVEIGPIPDSTIHQLGYKVLEAAAKKIPGYWEALKEYCKTHSREDLGFLPNYLMVSERSKLARPVLMGNYKAKRSELLDQLSPELIDISGQYLTKVENIKNIQESGNSDFETEILSTNAYKELPDTQKVAYLRDIIQFCHNTSVFHEVYNSGLNEAYRHENLDTINPSLDPNEVSRSHIIGRGQHSILFQTAHSGISFQLPKYNEFERDDYLGDGDFPFDQYGYEKTIETAVEELAHIAAPEDIPFILDFWDKNRDPAYGPAIASSVSKIDASRGAQETLERVKHASELDRQRLLSFLFRLELGKVGISAEGLNYLGRRFDLGEYNSPDFYAQRITASGKVGIFGRQRQLEGFVQLESTDFEQDQTDLSKEVLDISYEILFSPRPDETPEERAERERILQQFKAQYFDTFLGLFSEKSDLRFNNLELPEQGWVLNYLHHTNDSQKDTFFNFVGQFGEDGFRAFRSLEFGSEMAEVIIDISQNTNPEVAKRIFAKYTEIINATEQVRQILNNNLGEQEFSDDQIEDIVLNLLQRGKNLLVDFSGKSFSQDSEDYGQTPDKLYAELEETRIEVLTFASMFRVMKKTTETSFNDFKYVSVEQDIAGSELTPHDRVAMLRILKLNWYKPEFQTIYPVLLEAMEQSFSSQNVRYQIVKYQPPGAKEPVIITFQRFEQLTEGVAYAAGNNVHPAARGSRIGEAGQKEILSRELEKNIVVADVYAKLDVVSHYVNHSGFIITGGYRLSQGGEPYLILVNDKNSLYSKNGDEVVVHMDKIPSTKDQGLYSQIDEHFLDTINRFASTGKAITQFRRDQNDPGTVYLTIEPYQSQINVTMDEHDEPVIGHNDQPIKEAA